MTNPYYTYTPNNKTEAVSSTAYSPGSGPEVIEVEAVPVNAYVVDEPRTESAPKSKVGSALTFAAGGCIALVGVPMLVLPGPGLLAIGGGVALMARGAKGLFGKK